MTYQRRQYAKGSRRANTRKRNIANGSIRKGGRSWDRAWVETSMRFEDEQFAEIKRYAEKNNCHSFGEAVRTLCEIALEEVNKCAA